MARKRKPTKAKPPSIEELADAIEELDAEVLDAVPVKGIIGRPVAIATVEEMEARIIEYLNSLTRWGLPTKAGLAFALGMHRETLNQYEKKEGFSDVLKAWYPYFEDRWVQNLARPNATGTIFYLKNTYGYTDTIDHSSGGRPIAYQIPAEIASKHSLALDVPKPENETVVQPLPQNAITPETERSGS